MFFGKQYHIIHWTTRTVLNIYLIEIKSSTVHKHRITKKNAEITIIKKIINTQFETLETPKTQIKARIAINNWEILTIQNHRIRSIHLDEKHKAIRTKIKLDHV